MNVPGGVRRLPPAAVDQLVKVGAQAGAHGKRAPHPTGGHAEWASTAKRDRPRLIVAQRAAARGRRANGSEPTSETPSANVLLVGPEDGQDGTWRRSSPRRQLRRRVLSKLGRRLARRRGAAVKLSRQADPVRLKRREARRLRALTSDRRQSHPRDGVRDDAVGRPSPDDGARRRLERKIRKERSRSTTSQQMKKVRTWADRQPSQDGPVLATSSAANVARKSSTALGDHHSMTPASAPTRYRRVAPARIARGSGPTCRPSASGQAVAQMKGHEQVAAQDAIAAAVGRRSLTSAVYVSPSPPHPRGKQEESDLARGGRRWTLAPRRALHRDDRPLQPADRAVDDPDR